MTPFNPSWRIQFSSDNATGICPQAWEAMEKANHDANSLYAVGYGQDAITAKAVQMIQELFETDCEVYFVFNGSAANALALASICQPYHGILCHPYSHVHCDEANAPEFFTGGAKLLMVDGPSGKIDPAELPAMFARGSGVHSARIRGVSITQCTEMGAVYSSDEIRGLTAIREAFPDNDVKFHMDGARFANAVAAGTETPRQLTWEAGIDVLTFGGTKNGCPGTEALVIFDRSLAHEFAWRRKQAGQLASKMRFLSAPWVGMLENDVWLKNARHANDHAQILSQRLTAIEGVSLAFDVETNAVFAQLPAGLGESLHDRGWYFHRYPEINAWRLMCAWNTRAESIDALIADITELLEAQA